MKRILFILALTAISMVTVEKTHAQVATMNGATGDSSRINGTATGHVDITLNVLDYKCGSFQVLVRRVSAAQAGTAALQASNDGTNFVATAAADTFHVTNAASSTGFIDIAPATGLKYKYYRISLPGTSGDTCTLRGVFNGRR